MDGPYSKVLFQATLGAKFMSTFAYFDTKLTLIVVQDIGYFLLVLSFTFRNKMRLL